MYEVCNSIVLEMEKLRLRLQLNIISVSRNMTYEDLKIEDLQDYVGVDVHS